jgi:hypothetical protein
VTCTLYAVRVVQTHVLSGISAAVTEATPNILGLNTKLVLSEDHPRIWKVGSLSQPRFTCMTCNTIPATFWLAGSSWQQGYLLELIHAAGA